MSNWRGGRAKGRIVNKSEYRDYLWGRHWRRLRMKLRRKTVSCELCALRFSRMVNGWHVHHWTYRNVPKEREDDLSVLCAPCHRDAHEILDARESDPFRYIERELIREVLVPAKFAYENGAIVPSGVLWFSSRVCVDPREFSIRVHEKIMMCGEGFPA